MKQINVTLISGRTIKQGTGLEEGKTSEAYINSVNYIVISQLDAELLNLKDNNNVQISNKHGSVVVKWKKSETLDQGIAFIPYGPWANQLYNEDTEGTGMPLFKGINVLLEEAPNQIPPTLTELIDIYMRGK